jgi:hypothetical protein
LDGLTGKDLHPSKTGYEILLAGNLHPFCAESGPFLSGKMSRFPGIRAAQKSKNCPGKKPLKRRVASLPLARSKVTAKGAPG